MKAPSPPLSVDDSIRVTPVTSLPGHKERLSSVVWSSDGQYLLSASADGEVAVWSFPDFTEVRRFQAHSSWINALAVVPNTTHVVTASSDGTLGLWDFVTGKDLQKYVGHLRDVFAAAVSPDGRTLISGSADRMIHIWDLSSGALKEMREGHEQTILSVALADNAGPIISAADDGTVRLWKWTKGDSGQQTTTTNRTSIICRGHTAPVRAVLPLPRLGVIVSCSMDQTIRLWNANSGRQAGSIEGHTGPIGALAASHDCSLVASVSFDGTVRIWETVNWQTVCTLGETCSRFPTGVAFHPTAPVLATVGNSNSSIHIRQLERASAVASHEPSVVRYTNAKVILVGEQGSGKSCLARALSGLDFEPQESTHGLRVLTMPEPSEIPDPTIQIPVLREIIVWDLAGQPDYELVHQLFLDQTTIALVVFDPGNGDQGIERARRWREVLKRLAPAGCPTVLVAGRIDRSAAAYVREDLDALCQKHEFTDYVATSARTGEGIGSLRTLIERLIPWDDLPVTSSPREWELFRQFIMARGNGTDALARIPDLESTFALRSPSSTTESRELDTVLSHLQTQGRVWKLSFGDLVLLKPELLNDYASAIVRTARQDPKGLGAVSERAVLDGDIDWSGVPRLARRGDERALLHAVVQLLLEREVAFREGELLVFPSRINVRGDHRPSDSPPWHERYHFEGPVEQVYATLVARLTYSGVFVLQSLSKDAAYFRDHHGRPYALRLTTGRASGAALWVGFDRAQSADTAGLFARFISEHLGRRAIAKTVRRERVYYCPNATCGHEAADTAAIEFRLRNGLDFVRCAYCDSRIDIGDAVDGLHNSSETSQGLIDLDTRVDRLRNIVSRSVVVKAKRDRGEFDVFLAYNRQDQEAVAQIASQLVERGLSPWFDAWNVPPGRLFDEEIQRALPMTKTAAVFVGPSGLGKWERLEVSASVKLFVERRRPVIPVLLPGAQPEPEVPLFLSQFAWVHFRTLEDQEALSNLCWGISSDLGHSAAS